MIRRTLLVAWVVLAVAGCASVPPAPLPAVTVPPSWSATGVDAAALAPTPAWWSAFDSEELTRLLDAALRHNRELQAARSRLAQAHARAVITGAAAAPQLEAGAGVSRDRPTGGTAGTQWRADFAASYEIDVFGRQRSGSNAAGERVRAGAFALEAARLSVQAEVATRYFSVLSLRDRIALAERSLANAESTLALLQTQQRAGAVSGLEVLRQRALVSSVQASLPPLQRQMQQSLDALAVLTGQAPSGLAIGGTRLAALRLPAVAPGMPATLLQRRPDIRQAEAELAAAHADVAAARAALFPAFSLTADGGARSANLSTLLRSGSLAWNLGAGLAATLFDGGRRQGEVQLSEARRDELLALYEQSILSALRDVEDGLAEVSRGAEQAAHQQQTIEHARAALRMAELRYRNGAVDFSIVLDAQRVLLAAEDAQESLSLARFVGAVGLFRALGGGWSGESAELRSAAAGR